MDKSEEFSERSLVHEHPYNIFKQREMTKLRFSLFVFFVFVRANTHGFTNVYPKLKKFVLDKNADVGEPLFLTPLIESGKINEARKEATVEHNEIGAVSSYSGYFTVNKEYNSNLFFWFFPAQAS